MRIQFSVDANQYKILKEKSQKEGYPDVNTYCKDKSLEERTYQNLWMTVKKRIEQMKEGDVFALRDIVDVPPISLGRKLYDHQKELNIEKLKKDGVGSNIFRKVAKSDEEQSK